MPDFMEKESSIDVGTVSEISTIESQVDNETLIETSTATQESQNSPPTVIENDGDKSDDEVIQPSPVSLSLADARGRRRALNVTNGTESQTVATPARKIPKPNSSESTQSTKSSRRSDVESAPVRVTRKSAKANVSTPTRQSRSKEQHEQTTPKVLTNKEREIRTPRRRTKRDESPKTPVSRNTSSKDRSAALKSGQPKTSPARKRTTKSPTVIPQSPIGLIGTRSLVTRSLRNRTPRKS